MVPLPVWSPGAGNGKGTEAHQQAAVIAVETQRAEAMAAYSRALLEPLVARLGEQEAIIREQAEQIGRQTERIAALEAQLEQSSPQDAPGRPVAPHLGAQPGGPTTGASDPSPEPPSLASDPPPLPAVEQQPWWRRWWRWAAIVTL